MHLVRVPSKYARMYRALGPLSRMLFSLFVEWD